MFCRYRLCLYIAPTTNGQLIKCGFFFVSFYLLHTILAIACVVTRCVYGLVKSKSYHSHIATFFLFLFVTGW